MKLLQLPKRHRAFTLIELLTVIAVIAILAGILIPTVGAARRAMRKAEARALYTVISNGLQAFHGSYGYYPNIGTRYSSAESSISGVVFNADDADLVGILIGSDTTYNPHRQQFAHFTDNYLNDDDEVIDALSNEGFGIAISFNGSIPAAAVKGLKVKDPESGKSYHYEPPSNIQSKVFIWGFESVSKGSGGTVATFVTYPQQKTETTKQ